MYGDSKYKFLGFGGVVVAILAIGVGLMVYSSKQADKPAAIKQVTLKADDHVEASATSTVALVEFADFQCPACAAYHPFVEKLASDFPGSLKIVYRFFPLVNIHQNAFASASAAEAAGRQGKFQEMKKMLFEKQTDWATSPDGPNIFAGYAKDLGLDMNKYNADVKDQSVYDRIKEDVTSAQDLGVNSTPTFFLNGHQLTNPRSYDEFKSLIETAIQNAPQP